MVKYHHLVKGDRMEMAELFGVNDYIFHGGSGVCVVKEVGVPKRQWAEPGRTYYQLQPLYDQGSVIYTPTDNSKSIIRRILTPQEAHRLIDQIPYIDMVWVDNEKTREELYREVLKTNNCYEWVKIIKTLYLRNQARVQDGKRTTQLDEKYLRIAENLLYGELAIPLGIPKEEVGDYIAYRVEHPREQEGKCS